MMGNSLKHSASRKSKGKGTCAFKLSCAIASVFALVGCADQDRALVYGERSGVNIALRSDPAKALPLEVNAGVQRRVTTLVPATSRDPNTRRPTGEAVSLVSSFDLNYTPPAEQSSLFGGRTKIATIFTTGDAASKLGETINQSGGSAAGLTEAVEANRVFVEENEE